MDVDNDTALNLGAYNVLISLHLSQHKAFTNPLMYSDEETANSLLRITEQDRDDAQANGTMQPENLVTEAPPPTSEAPTTQNRQQTKSPTENASVLQSSPASSAAPNVKPQAKTLGVKRAREPEPELPRQPTGRNGRRAAKTVKPEEANEAKRPRYRLIAPKPPKIDVPCQRQALPVNMPPSRADSQYRNAPVSFAAPGGAVRDSGQQLNRHLQLAKAQMGFNPPVTPSPHSGSMAWTFPGSSVESWGAFSPNTPVNGGTFVGWPAARGMHFGPDGNEFS